MRLGVRSAGLLAAAWLAACGQAPSAPPQEDAGDDEDDASSSFVEDAPDFEAASDGAGTCLPPIPAADASSSVLLAASAGVFGIAADGVNVYWGRDDGAIVSCAVGGCGGQPAVLAYNPQHGAATGIAVDSTNVYWVQGGTVAKCAKTGCNMQATPLVSWGKPLNRIVVDASYAYFTSSDAQGNVMKCGLEGCANEPTVLLSQDTASGIAVDSTSVYWARPGSWLLKCPLDGCGGNPTLLARTHAGDVVVDASDVYWDDGASILKCAIGGCNDRPTVLACEQDPVGGIAIDSTHVYWTASSAVRKCAKSGCGRQPTQLAAYQFDPGPIAVDSPNVYSVTRFWQKPGVWKVAK